MKPVALNIPYHQKDAAKCEGLRWHAAKGTWKAHTPAALYKCREWAPPGTRMDWSKEWLYVPNAYHIQAMVDGALYDDAQRCFYTYPLPNKRIDRWRLRPFSWSNSSAHSRQIK